MERTWLFEKLAGEENVLSEANCLEIIEQGGDTLVPELIVLLLNRELADTDAPGRGLVPIHAVQILSRLKPAEAIEPMLYVLSRCDWMDVLYNDIIMTLKMFGAPALEPALREHKVYEDSGDAERKSAIAEILSGIGVKDPRILAIFVKMLGYDIVQAAGNLAEYGDPTVLPVLSNILEASRLKDSEQIIELAGAIEELGGMLSRRQQNLRERAIASRRARTAALDA